TTLTNPQGSVHALRCRSCQVHSVVYRCRHGYITSPFSLFRLSAFIGESNGRSPNRQWKKRFWEDTLTMPSILWRGIYMPGHEACRVFSQNAEWHFEGTAVFSYTHQPCRLSYLIVCDATWNTRRAGIFGWIGDRPIDIALVVDGEHRRHLNGIERPAVAGCIDLDTAHLIPRSGKLKTN